jgi:hypothetical protein
MFKLQTKTSVVKISQHPANQHSTQTIITPIALKQNRQQTFAKSGSIQKYTVKMSVKHKLVPISNILQNQPIKHLRS